MTFSNRNTSPATVLCRDRKTILYFSGKVYFYHTRCNTDHIFKCNCMRNTVADDNGFGYPENGNSAICFKIEALKMLILDLPAFYNIINAFCQFQYDITGEPFTNKYIRFV